jgi:transmembrane sensor
MAVDTERLTLLSFKYVTGTCALDEQLELDAFLDADPANGVAFEARIQREAFRKELELWMEAENGLERNWVVISDRLPAPAPLQAVDGKSKLVRLRWMASVAAALVLLIGGAILFTRTHKTNTPALAVARGLIKPGGNRAMLTLSNGKTILLDSAADGRLASEGRTTVTKMKSGQIDYSATGSAETVGFNTITTPTGGQYQVTLPDHSRVWLNAGSSLKFPTAFTGTTRDVEMTGEAYWEIARDRSKPFTIRAGSVKVSVLGTSLNIMAYTGEPSLQTTLISGQVRVEGRGGSVMLAPGQEAVAGTDRLDLIPKVDTATAVAWKEGFFAFNNADIQTVMRTVSRWYNVEVKYEGNVSAYHVDGIVNRNNPVEVVLNMLELSGFKFKIDDARKTITVLPSK